MAPKKMITNSLGDFEPTEEELQNARVILKNASDKGRSKMQAMAGFLRRNPGEQGHDAIKSTTGSSRWEYCARYLAFQSRKSAGTTRNFEEASETKTHETKQKRWTLFQLNQKFGEEKVRQAKP